jgi:Tol biopolymer transport system component
MPFQHFSLTRAIDNPHVRVTAISPDGRYIASVVRDQGVESLWVHNVPTNSERAILQDPSVRYDDLVFSPDSSYIYFSSPAAKKAPAGSGIDEGDLGQDDEMRIPVLGGTPSRVFQNVGAPISFIGKGQRVCIYREYESAGEWKYFSASADGGDEQLLYTGKAAFPQTPTCSPDGKLAVVEDESGKLETITFATGKTQLLAPPTLNHWYYALQWDPSGKGLFAITVEKFHYNGQLAYLTYPAGKLHQITNDLNDYSGISVTADASTIVTTQKDRNTHFIDLPLADTGHPQEHHLGDLEWFTWIDANRLLISGDNSVLKTADLSRDETETMNVAKDHFFFQPALCGPGAIVASGNTADQKNPGVYKMQMDGSVATRLTHGTQDLWPQCTPDGKQLFYSDDHDDQNHPKLMHLAIDSGAAQPFAEGVYLQVARDGKLIALHDVDKTSQLKLFSTDTLSLLKTMPMPPKASYFIALAADNKSIFYFERSEAGATLWRMPIDKGQPVQLASFPGRVFKYMQASPDGTRIGLVAQEPQSQVILVHDTQ